MEGGERRQRDKAQWSKHIWTVSDQLCLQKPWRALPLGQINQNVTLLGQVFSSFCCKKNPQSLTAWRFFSAVILFIKEISFLPLCPSAVLHKKGKGTSCGQQACLVSFKRINLEIFSVCFWLYSDYILTGWASSILLCSTVISIMAPKCQFTASHSKSLEEDGRQIFCFLIFTLIQN